MLKKAVSYVRVSSDEQAKSGFSIPQQISNNMQFALQEGYAIVQTFKDEGISAKDLNRPALQELLSYCMKKENFAICTNMNRPLSEVLYGLTHVKF